MSLLETLWDRKRSSAFLTSGLLFSRTTSQMHSPSLPTTSNEPFETIAWSFQPAMIHCIVVLTKSIPPDGVDQVLITWHMQVPTTLTQVCWWSISRGSIQLSSRAIDSTWAQTACTILLYQVFFDNLILDLILILCEDWQQPHSIPNVNPNKHSGFASDKVFWQWPPDDSRDLSIVTFSSHQLGLGSVWPH